MIKKIFFEKIELFISFVIIFCMEYLFSYLFLFKFNNGKACVFDVLVFSGYKTLPFVIIPIGIFVILEKQKEEFTISHVVRRKKVRDVWIHCCYKLAGYSLIFSVWTIITACITGLILTKQMYNWDESISFAFNKVNGVPFEVDFYNIIISLFISVFCGIFIIGLVAIWIWWWIGSPFIAYIIAICITFIEGCQRFEGLLLERYIFDIGIYFHGIIFQNQIIYPLGVSGAILLSFTFMIRKRDFLDKL